MKFDALGEYDENEIPKDFEWPLHIDDRNDGIAGDNNILYGTFFSTIQTVPKGFARRRAEFITRIVNNEIKVMKDKEGVQRVFVTDNVKTDRDGTVTVTYKPVAEAVNAVS